MKTLSSRQNPLIKEVHQLAEIYGDQKVFEVTGGQAGNNTQWSDFSLGQVAVGTLIGLGMHWLPGVSSWVKSKWTARTTDNGFAARLEIPIAQVTEKAKALLGSLAGTTGMQVLRKAGGILKFGVHEIALPKALSLTSKQADEWLLQKVDVFKNYLNGLNVSLREKAAMAINLRNDLVAAARNAIYDTRVTKWLNEQSPLWIMEEMIAKLRKTLSGDALHKEVVELATKVDDLVIDGKNYRGLQRECKFDGDCFVAGTLVHTDKGLVPIEQLKVGDMVLSKHESGEGEQAYKRVVRTFKSAEKKKIVYIKYNVFANNRPTGDSYLFCTEDHPFWTMAYEDYEDKENLQPLGWQPASSISAYDFHKLETYNKMEVFVVPFEQEKGLWASKNFEIALTVSKPAPRGDINGCIDFRGGKPQIVVNDDELKHYYDLDNKDYLHDSEPILDLTGLSEDDAQIVELSRLIEESRGAYIPYMATVYNIEVEDFHTYYVGNAGIWVHNTDGCFSELYPDTFTKAKDLNPQYNVKPLNDSALHQQFMEGLDTVPDGIANKGTNKLLDWIKENIADDDTRRIFGHELRVTDPTDVSHQYAMSANGATLTDKGSVIEIVALAKHKDIDVNNKVTRYFDSYRIHFDVTIGKFRLTLVDSKANYDMIFGKKKADGSIKKGFAGPEGNLYGEQGFFQKGAGKQYVNDLYKESSIISELASTKGFDELVLDIGRRFKFDHHAEGFNKWIIDPIKNGQWDNARLALKEIKTHTGKTISVDEQLTAIQKMLKGEGEYGQRYKILSDQSPDYDLHQRTQIEGSQTTSLTLDQLNQLLPTAKNYWLNLGVAANLLDNIQLNIQDLGTNIAAVTNGNQITFDSTGAGWGWFVDSTPQEHSEFNFNATGDEGIAFAGTDADGKLDLLSVLIHEMGHVLGLTDNNDHQDIMSGLISSGLRHLPTDIDKQAVIEAIDKKQNPSSGGFTGTPLTVFGITRVAPPQHIIYQAPASANNRLVTLIENNGAWQQIDGVLFNQNSATLQENLLQQSRLGQVFTVGANDVAY